MKSGPGPADAVPSSAPGVQFTDLPPADQLRVVEIFKPGFERALARYIERKRLEGEELKESSNDRDR